MEQREIKVRFWLTEKAIMSDVYTIDDLLKGGWYDIGPHITLQWTGLCDKNGKEIYVGDVLCIPDFKHESVTDEGAGPDYDFSHLAPVVFKDGCFGVQIEEGGEIYYSGFQSFCDLRRENDDTPDKLEIIGNIYYHDKEAN